MPTDTQPPHPPVGSSPLLEQLMLVADATPALLGYVGADRRYHYCNRAYSEWFGRPRSELVGRTLVQVLGAEAAAAIEPHVARALAGEQVRYERAVPYRDGGTRVVDATYTPDVGPEGVVRGFVVLVNDVTELRRKEEALHQAERFRLAMLATSDAVWDWDVAGLRLEWSNQLEVLFGHPPSSEAGTIAWWEARVHPEDRARVVASLHAALAPGAAPGWREEYRFRRADGSWAHVVDRAHVLRDAAGRGVRVVGAMQDVTAEREAMAALRAAQDDLQRSELRLRTLLEALPLGVWIADERGQLLWTNTAGRELWGQAHLVPMERYGDFEAWWADSGVKLRSEDWALARALTRGETSRGERLRIRTFRGETRLILNSAVPLRDAAGTLIGALVLNEDVTERERTEAERAAAEELLRQTAEFRERFLSIVSHDLRNSLQAIAMSAQTLHTHVGEPGRVLRAAERITRSSEHMGRLLREVLDYARVRLGGGIPVERGPVDLGAVCAGVVDELQAAFPGREVTLVTTGDLHGRWDGARLAQVVQNLVSNALKHGAADSPVRVAVQGGAGDVELTVHNLGPPIPEALRPHLFEAFRHGGSGDGLGLGLYIAQQVVQGHGGTLTLAHSDAARGTLLRVQLPRG